MERVWVIDNFDELVINFRNDLVFRFFMVEMNNFLLF